MKTWFKRRFPDEFIQNAPGEIAMEIRRCYAHIEKTEALLARAEKIVEIAHHEDDDDLRWLEDFKKFKGGE